MAVLDYLIEKKSRMIITTHHGILKNYGYTRAGVENASVEFNAQTLSPTYKIINGVPGESRALDIAEGNGLDSAIVQKARSYIDEDKSDISELISGLEQKHKELAGIEQRSAIEQNRLREEIRKADLKELQLRQKEAELNRESVGKLQSFLNESRKTLENLVRELKESEANIDREKTLKVKEFLNDLARNAENESAALDEEEQTLKELSKKERAEDAAEFAPDMEVFAGPSKQRGVIVRLDKKSAKGSSWIVKVGSLKMSFNESDLLPASPSKANVSPSWAAEYDSPGEAVIELKLLGMRLNEATDALRRQIEAASRHGIKTFSVIHGTGSGVLQKGIHDYLKQDPAVEDYYFSRPEIGGFGRTEVVLR
jgi:DNA mismatch repair protein MutS2